MQEIEIKIPVTHGCWWVTYNNLITGMSSNDIKLAHSRIKDTYYDTKTKGIDATLRIRHTESLSPHPWEENGKLINCFSTQVTAKGPKKVDLNGLTSREELEIDIYNIDEFEQFFRILGFEVLGVVDKERRTFQHNGTTVCLDNVKGLGYFIEVEVVSESTEEAQKLINNTLKDLGLENNQPETRGYIELVLGSK